MLIPCRLIQCVDQLSSYLFWVSATFVSAPEFRESINSLIIFTLNDANPTLILEYEVDLISIKENNIIIQSGY